MDESDDESDESSVVVRICYVAAVLFLRGIEILTVGMLIFMFGIEVIASGMMLSTLIFLIGTVLAAGGVDRFVKYLIGKMDSDYSEESVAKEFLQDQQELLGSAVGLVALAFLFGVVQFGRPDIVVPAGYIQIMDTGEILTEGAVVERTPLRLTSASFNLTTTLATRHSMARTERSYAFPVPAGTPTTITLRIVSATQWNPSAESFKAFVVEKAGERGLLMTYFDLDNWLSERMLTPLISRHATTVFNAGPHTKDVFKIALAFELGANREEPAIEIIKILGVSVVETSATNP